MRPNPDLYHRLAVPVAATEADRRLADFQTRIEALREECGIAEFVAICGVYTSEEPGKISLTIAACGNQERGVELAKKLVQHLAGDLAAAYLKRIEDLAPDIGDKGLIEAVEKGRDPK